MAAGVGPQKYSLPKEESAILDLFESTHDYYATEESATRRIMELNGIPKYADAAESRRIARAAIQNLKRGKWLFGFSHPIKGRILLRVQGQETDPIAYRIASNLKEISMGGQFEIRPEERTISASGKVFDSRTNEYEHHLVIAALRACLGSQKGTVAQVGCGPGQLSEYLAAEGHHPIMIDRDADFIARGIRKGRRGMTLASATKLTDAKGKRIEDGSLNAVVSDHFLISNFSELRGIEDDIIAEMHRALKPGGWLILNNAKGDAAEIASRLGYKFRVVHSHVRKSGLPSMQYHRTAMIIAQKI